MKRKADNLKVREARAARSLADAAVRRLAGLAPDVARALVLERLERAGLPPEVLARCRVALADQ